MTEEQMQSAQKQLIYLLGCAVRGEKPDSDRITDCDHIMEIAANHMLTAAAAYALKSAGITNERVEKSFFFSHRNTILYKQAWDEIAAHLDKAEIWYMPLKGALLKELYPNAVMREMSDYDVLIDSLRAKDVKAIMEESGFSTEDFGKSNHDIYYKSPVLNFEIHTQLFGFINNKEIYEYYSDVKSKLIRVRGFEYHFSPEDCYIYLISHEYKHFCNKGTGLRSLLDIYVYLKNTNLDMNYVKAETEKLSISEFEQSNRSLALNLFGEKALSDADQEMLDYILSSGAYGTVDNQVENYIRKNDKNIHGTLSYILTRLFIPMNDLKVFHPFVYNHRFLLPFLMIPRFFRAIFIKREQIKQELISIRKFYSKKKEKK